MASEDETIRIQVDSVEARAQLAALEKEVRELEAELKTLNSTAGVTNAEIEGTTRRLGEARAKFAEAGAAVQSFGQSTVKAGFNLKDLSKNVGAGISVIAILQENLRALEPVLDKIGEGLKFAAEQAGASHDSVEQAALGFDMLIHPSHIIENNVKLLANAWKGLMEEMVPSSTVITNNVKSIEESLKILESARKKSADDNEDAKKKEERAAKSLAEEEERLEKAAVKSAEARAKAEAKAAEEVVASLEKQRIALDDAVKKADEALVAAQKNTDAAEAAQFDAPSGSPSGATDPRLAEMEKLRLTMAELNALPAQTPEQVVQLAEAQDSYAKLNTQIKKFNFGLGESGTLMGQVSAADAELNAQRDRAISLLERSQSLHDQAIDRLEQEEGGYGRLSASMQEFVDVGLKAGDGIQGTFSDAGASATEAGNSVKFLSEQADDAVGSIEGVAEAAGSLGETAKEGTDKAKEGMDGISEAVGSLTGKLTEAEVVIDRIAVKLAALQLGS